MNVKRIVWMIILASGYSGYSGAVAQGQVSLPERVEALDLARLAEGQTMELGSHRAGLRLSRMADQVSVWRTDAEGIRRSLWRCSLDSEGCAAEIRHLALAEELRLSKRAMGTTEVLLLELVGGTFGGGGGATTMAEHSVRSGRTGGSVPVEGSRGRSETLLRCPEGDTLMRLEEREDVAYLCPRHGLKMVRGGGGSSVFREPQ